MRRAPPVTRTEGGIGLPKHRTRWRGTKNGFGARCAEAVRVLAATQAAAVDLAAEQRAAGPAEQRADQAVAACVDGAAEQSAGSGADDQAGRAVAAAAVIASVVTA